MIDLHVHTWRCRHATGTAEQYVRAAAARGLTTIAFTEHLPLVPELTACVPCAEEYAMPPDELPEYIAEVNHASVIGKEIGVEVLLGAEVDLDRISRSYCAQRVSLSGFDVVLGSVHFIDDWAFDDPSRQKRQAEWRLEDLWSRYFADLEEAARDGQADVMAHADLVKKFTRCPDDALDLYRHAAAVFADTGVAVEVSSAGLRKPCRELYPSMAFLKELNKAGVSVTIGSDAHSPEDIGEGLEEAVAAVRMAGYTSVVVFRNRIPEEVALDAL